LNILINCIDGNLLEGNANFIIKGKDPNIRLLVFGNPILFHADPFCPLEIEHKFNSISEVVPHLTGDFLIIEERFEKVVAFAVDFFGHSRYYYTIDKNSTITISKSASDFFSNNCEFDYYQIFHFLLKGYTWKGGTFINDLKIICPSIKYLLHENGLIEEIVKIPEVKDRASLEDQVSKVLNGIAKCNPESELNLMFSGGKDSTFIALILNDCRINFNAIYNKYTNPTFSLNALDALLSSNVAASQGFKYTELNNDANSDISKFVLKTISLLPFEFHISIAQRNIIDFASKSSSKIVLTGQNADSLYNFGFTGTYTHYKAIIKFLLGILKPEEYENFVHRYFQSDRVIKSIAENSPSWLTKSLWKAFNPSAQLTLLNLLSVFTFNGTAIPIFEWRSMEVLANKKGQQQVYERNKKEIADLIKEYKNGNIFSLRELLIRIKLLGHCQGKDVRCITEWCREYGLKNIQVYSASPVFWKLLHLPITLKDIYQPKYLIYRFIKKRVNYDKLDKLIQKQYDNKSVVQNENELFSELVSQIDRSLVINGVQYAIEILKKSDFFNLDIIEKRAEADHVFRLKLFWLGMSLKNITQTT